MTMSTRGGHLQHCRPTVPGTDLDRGTHVVGQMYAVTLHPPQTVRQDHLQRRLPDPVERRFWRYRGLELQMNREAVALVRSNPAAGLDELNRRLSLRSTISTSSSCDSAKWARAHAASNSSTDTQPAGFEP
jgi:hypothetical protein